MQEQTMMIDFEFGLRQLNGNQTLLYKLLRKFATEYQTLGTRLQTMLAEQDLQNAENLIHTLKGVSGNLGCTSVYQSSRLVNEELKHGIPEQHSLKSLLDNLSATIQVINDLPDDNTAAPGTVTSTVNEKQATRKALEQALQHHEYINDEKLANWLSTLQLDSARQAQLADAVSSLDYDRALEILAETDA